ncbi:hypothetical protein DVH24_017563 [Malus domestica]|uniref:Uncharacterized protein n=2 Tax=Maleae TaxID=721813 RepID=A0A498KDN8_MALDO|nr:hypothetical protein DVH24_017563 [Malus domestica]
MAESITPILPNNPNPNYQGPATGTVPPSPPPSLPLAGSPPPPPLPAAASRTPVVFSFPKRPSVRLTSEFDSDSSVFFHKVSCKLLDSLAKLKLSFSNNHKGELSPPQLTFVSKNLSVHHNFEDQSTLLNGSVDVGQRIHLRATHHLQAQEGEATVVAKLADPGYALELSSPVPYVGLPKATLKFPLGEVSVEEKQEEEKQRMLSINGIVKGHILNGLCTAHYVDEDLKLRYLYKDEEMSLIPALCLPSNALSFAFKRRFGPSDKLRCKHRNIYMKQISYWYNFDSNYWSAVYKHTYGKDLKLKAGYDSEVRLGWASLWVGDEGGKAKTAPMKMKVQFMLQVPQDDIRSSALMFRWLCGHLRRDQDIDSRSNEDATGASMFGSDEEVGTQIPTQAQSVVEGSGAVMVSEFRPVADVDYLQELLAIQQQGPRAIGFFGTRNMGFMHQELIEILSYAMVITKNHIYTSGASGTNAAVIRGALRAEKPELLTVILPQSLKKQPPESQELLSKVKNVIEKPQNDHLPLIEASRLCNMNIISHVQQVICFAFHDSRLLMETCQEAKNLRKIVTLFYLD